MLAILSDVHANLAALDAVLRDVFARAPSAKIVCAGDIVGYGPDPEECIERLLDLGAGMVIGNHEEMVLGRRDFSRCTHSGIRAAIWTRGRISKRARRVLEGLPQSLELEGGVVVCHGSLASADEYVSTATLAERALAQLRLQGDHARTLVCGHTHEAMCFSRHGGLVRRDAGAKVTLEDLSVVNPGAVGQQRSDGRPVARWALLDEATRSMQWFSVPYDATATIERLRSAGLRAAVTLVRPQGVGRVVDDLHTRAVRAWAQRGTNASRVTLPGPSVRAAAASHVRRALAAVGVGKLAAHSGATILIYHAITDADDAPFVDPRFATPLPIFRRQMELLAAKRHVVPLGALLETLARGEAPKPGTVVLTFDDGYRSTLERALPILERFGFPSVHYLPTAYVAREETPFIDRLYTAVRFRTRDRVTFDFGHFDFSRATSRRYAYGMLEHHLTARMSDERTAVLREIEAQLRPQHAPPPLTMSWDEVLTMRSRHRTAEIAVHTREHVDLSACTPERAAQEIQGSIDDARDVLGECPVHFAFPFGRSSVGARAALEQSGLRSGATAVCAHVRPGVDLLQLPRLAAPSDMSLFEFYTR